MPQVLLLIVLLGTFHSRLSLGGPGEVVIISSFDWTRMNVGGGPLGARAQESLLRLEGQMHQISRDFYHRQNSATVLRTRSIYQANAFDLWRELHNPENIGVIWISHASGNATTGAIRDASGFNVTDVFQDFHQGLRFLAVIGCASAIPIQNVYVRQGVRRRFPGLWVYTERELVSQPLDRLQVALAFSRPALRHQDASHEPAIQRHSSQEHQTADRSPPTLRITRTLEASLTDRINQRTTNTRCGTGPANPDRFPPLWIQNSRGRIVGFFPAGQRAQVQAITIELDAPPTQTSATHAPETAYWITAGEHPHFTQQCQNIGQLHTDQAQWRVQLGRENTELGVESRVLLLESAPSQ